MSTQACEAGVLSGTDGARDEGRAKRKHHLLSSSFPSRRLHRETRVSSRRRESRDQAKHEARDPQKDPGSRVRETVDSHTRGGRLSTTSLVLHRRQLIACRWTTDGADGVWQQGSKEAGGGGWMVSHACLLVIASSVCEDRVFACRCSRSSVGCRRWTDAGRWSGRHESLPLIA